MRSSRSTSSRAAECVRSFKGTLAEALAIAGFVLHGLGGKWSNLGAVRVAPGGSGRSDYRGAPNAEEVVVSEATYKVTEVVGTSPESIQKAVRNGIVRASKTLRNLDWFEVTEIRGHIVDGDVGHFQVTMKIGFKMEG
jgi:flavin-binding protein dodecin